MKASQGNSLEGTSTNLDVSLARLGRAFTALARNKERELVVDVASDLHAKINQIDFEEIIGNLLDNALKWSASQIRLSATPSDEWILVQVEDDGPGMGDDIGDRPFVSGQRLDESKPGTGLGLAIASDLVAAYQGKIEITRSESMGGAMVVVALRRSV
nr:ATP-binding protein [Yoonia sp. F2084L]